MQTQRIFLPFCGMSALLYACTLIISKYLEKYAPHDGFGLGGLTGVSDSFLTYLIFHDKLKRFTASGAGENHKTFIFM